MGTSGLSPIYIARDSFLIGWEAEKPQIDELPSSVSHFNIYYRKLFQKKWILLKSTCGFRLSTTISVADLGGYDSYELGVAEVLNNGKIMEIHSSSDTSARPAGGWYLVISPP
ncbi:hypothetical protein [Marispirochaeta aestuarii]|uniref:hypothetical protein n=1 Tax=Marispirochaeta aestuarii TaxID=1963862 RepID=UPI0029C99D25|nr:hypothetical protein [Marispirochaeta aestuarii]